MPHLNIQAVNKYWTRCQSHHTSIDSYNSVKSERFVKQCFYVTKQLSVNVVLFANAPVNLRQIKGQPHMRVYGGEECGLF